MQNIQKPTCWRSIAFSTLFGVAVIGSMASAASTQSSTDGATVDQTQLKTQTSPVLCTANQTVKLDSVLLKVDRAAIEASGNCKVQVTNSRIVGRVVVMATGNAEISFENAIVDGALSLTGNSTTSFKQSTVTGRVRKLQSAAVKDLGHNIWH